MSIVQYQTRQEWDNDGRFHRVKTWADVIVITDDPQVEEGAEPGPHDLVPFTQYERYDDARGTGWEVTEQATDTRQNFPHLETVEPQEPYGCTCGGCYGVDGCYDCTCGGVRLGS